MNCILAIAIAVLVKFGSCIPDDNVSKLPIAALVLARGGSKGIPLKNIVEIQPNQTMLGRALDTIQKSGIFSSIWVSTDHEQIAAEADRHGATVFARSPMYAQDHSTSLEATREFLDAHPEIKHFALIQCTSPFLRVDYLVQAAQHIRSCVDNSMEMPSCVFSVVRSYKLRWLEDVDSGRLQAINFNPMARPRRQDWLGELVETGMFYFSDRQLIMEMGSFQNEMCTVVEVDELDALEIDNLKHLTLARVLIKME
ncbi:N-acylneuraminate cytidylyltransferase A [Anopheles marshallii]|uniref:N-acylneuraminate cytidylyltransferase A n=1 Tax=Anopheles marshallii TaxID=1521116 RepID=UPI00237C145F|nr:N-acylneuraminate cytidylyltransferase A [Anopheles marshallii]